MKTAAQSAQKMVDRAGQASGDYVSGAEQTTKDQAQAAIAGKENWKAGLLAAQSKGSFEKGLTRSGKAGWLAGVKNKGANRFGEGVLQSAGKYATNSGKFDQARQAANSLPRGPKGSAGNLLRVTAVVNALRLAK